VSLEEARVVEVFAPTGSGADDSFGSGYLVADDLVLTARHVVESASGPCEVRPLGMHEWLPAEVQWLGAECDAALLRFAGQGSEGQVRLGRLATGARAPCRSLGFPLAQAKERVRDTEEIVGEVAPLAARKSGLLTVHIEGSVPDQDASGHSPWEGYSGAALFCGPLLVGVLAVDPAHFGTGRLEAVPVTAMAEEADFRAALNVSLPDLLPAFEDEPARASLTAPYAPLPARASPDFFRRSPIHLLYPQYGIVPFHGRGAELAELARWLEGEEGFNLALLLGRGGSGKTRLAAELCRAQTDRGWVVGFLTPEADVDALVSAVSPLLLVFDEAHSRLDELVPLILRFATADRKGQTRLLLVSRELGEWWDTALPQRLEGELEAELALDSHWARELGPLEEAATARREAFDGAARAFAARMEHSSDGVSEPELAAELFERVLFIHLAALTGLEGGTITGGPLVGAQLLDARLRQEAHHWENGARQAGLADLDERVRRRAVAVATLAAADTEREAADLLAAVPDLSDAGEGVRRQVARWLNALYPGDGFLRPLEPDLLGEHLVASVLGEVPELAREVIVRSAPDKVRRPLTVLTRAARTYDAAAVALGDVLRDELPSLWAAAIEVAVETGDPVGALLAQALTESPRPEIVAAMLTRLPDDTVALRELASVATEQALLEVRAKPAGDERDMEAAALLNTLSNRLGELGRREEGLAASEEAVAVYRGLVEARPDAFRADLALALTNLSNRLGELGRREEALAAGEEAVAVYRVVVEAGPDEFEDDLALSLTNLSNRLSDLGRREEGLAASEEAVAVYRGLVEARPDAFQPDLALSLNRLGNRLGGLGRHEEAYAASEEAVAVYRGLVEARPDAFLPELASSLNSFTVRLHELGREEEALAPIEEAVAIRRRQAEARPEAFLPDLAMSLNNLSNCLAELGRREEGLAASEEAVAIRRRQAEAYPDVFLPDLASTLINLSNRLGELGRREEALAASEEAVAVYRGLAEARPDVFQDDLAMALTNLSIELGELGRREEALAAGEEGVAVYRRAVEARPDAFQPALAWSLSIVSYQLYVLGRPEEGLAASEEADAIRAADSASNPSE
jgi:Trypsin-like peptidase domain/Tetratricopeptide repeat